MRAGPGTGAVGSAIMPLSSGQFGFALSVDGASSGAGANSTVTLALAAGPGGDTLTVSTAHGVITDSGLTLKKERSVYKLVSTTAGTRAALAPTGPRSRRAGRYLPSGCSPKGRARTSTQSESK